MRLCDYLDKGASLGADRPCLTMDGATLTYGEVTALSWRVARALDRSGIRPGDKVAVLSANNSTAFACVFGISRAGAVWCPVNPRSEAAENRELLDLLDCTALIFQSAFAPLVERIRGDLPKLRTLVRLDDGEPGHEGRGDGSAAGAVPFRTWTAGLPAEPWEAAPADDIVMIAGTGGTTGRPKGVMLGARNIEAMSALTLMSYPIGPRPVYLALAPLTHAAGVLCFPVLTRGGEIVVMPRPDLGEFLALVERHRVTHTFLPPTLLYALLAHPALDSTDTASLQCLWYGAAPMAPARLEEAIGRLGPVFGQLFGQTEAPMMVAAMAPADHVHADGTVVRERLASAGRPTPLVTVGIMAGDGTLLPAGERGEIVVRGSLVMPGYYKNPEATAEASRHGWHHTGDVGYLDADGYLFIVDRLKDMIITGGFNVYSAEVEKALLDHPDVQDCAVIGLPDEKWGERVTAVVQLHQGRAAEPEALRAFAKERLGGVKAPKQIEVWADLPRSTVGKVLKPDIKQRLLA
ncbi:acyl-CoA synthetase [Yinghuangia soli]|uniref:Long-chain fatty acid--CoA ligase n=1 Tax=Yinghuangia soli TaxID=2908204 RepID=A0AA41U1I8_9ACTN|nr:long-chain fatty acid--CoA ligase [Yinghuangia soli]MCF2529681.1 long-chain fatty acid--CoA ligase [Yinghuangia soli]